MEILAVSVHQPFGDTSKPSKCYIFDLPNNKILYQGHVLPFNVEFVGVQQLDPKRPRTILINYWQWTTTGMERLIYAILMKTALTFIRLTLWEVPFPQGK